jgi:hypothetical protein
MKTAPSITIYARSVVVSSIFFEIGFDAFRLSRLRSCIRAHKLRSRRRKLLKASETLAALYAAPIARSPLLTIT